MRPRSGLPGSAALVRPLQAVVGGIAHHVGERVLDQVEHLAVELGFGALHVEVDLLAELGGKIAHDARKFLPGVADRLHARLHHAFLQLGGDVGEALQRRLEFGILVAADDFQKLVAGEHQLGNHGHQLFEGIDGDADRLVGASAAVVVGWFWRSLGGLCRERFDGGWRKARSRSSSAVFAGTQRTFQHLRHQRADGLLAPRPARRAARPCVRDRR